MRQGGWKRLEMAQRYAHAIPIKDRTSLPNPMAEAKIIQYRRAADSEKPTLEGTGKRGGIASAEASPSCSPSIAMTLTPWIGEA
jgi:hypothetical protein